MAAAPKRAKPGDVLEVRTPRGLAYVQYAGKHPKYGDAIRVLPGFFQTRPQDWRALLSQEGYFTFYPVGAAVSQKLVEIASRQQIPPGRELPTRHRRSGWITPEGKVTLWFIVDGEQEIRRTELSEEEKRLFIASIWNHAFLVGSLVDEWRPELESSELFISKNPSAYEAPAPATGENNAPGRLVHYLYFPTQKASKAVAAELQQRGFDVVSRRGADGKAWLVLASHPLADPEQLETVRDELEQLAQRHSGEYDGSELATSAQTT
jgi:hypothetical protein